MRKIIFAAVVLLISLVGYTAVFSQVTITGPTCVTPGAMYQYTISGNWDSTSTMQVCINGGTIYDDADTNECTLNGPPIARVLVDWDTSGNWSLNVTSSSGNTSLNVSAITPLTPGFIDSASKIQMIAHDSIPAAITCSADVGGSCAPNYSYQWQQSSDMAEWIDIPGATGTSLYFSDTLPQSTFFRRKVTETISGTIGASDAAAIYLVTQIKSDTTQADSSSTGFKVPISRQGNNETTLRGNNRCGQASYINLFITFLTGSEAADPGFKQDDCLTTSPGNCLSTLISCNALREKFLLTILKNGNQQPA